MWGRRVSQHGWNRPYDQVEGNYVFFNNTWQTNSAQVIMAVNLSESSNGICDTNNHFIDDQTPYRRCQLVDIDDNDSASYDECVATATAIHRRKPMPIRRHPAARQRSAQGRTSIVLLREHFDDRSAVRFHAFRCRLGLHKRHTLRHRLQFHIAYGELSRANGCGAACKLGYRGIRIQWHAASGPNPPSNLTLVVH